MRELYPARGADPLRIERLHPLQIEAYRRMSSEERIAAGSDATDFVRKALAAHFHERHPDWTESQIEHAVARRFLGQPG